MKCRIMSVSQWGGVQAPLLRFVPVRSLSKGLRAEKARCGHVGHTVDIVAEVPTPLHLPAPWLHAGSVPNIDLKGAKFRWTLMSIWRELCSAALRHLLGYHSPLQLPLARRGERLPPSTWHIRAVIYIYIYSSIWSTCAANVIQFLALLCISEFPQVCFQGDNIVRLPNMHSPLTEGFGVERCAVG